MTTLECILTILIILLLIVLIPCVIMVLIFGDTVESIMPKFKQKHRKENKYTQL